MPVRKANEPQIFPGATAPESALEVKDEPVFVYLTDSSETNRVRTALAVDTIVEVRCLFTRRELTRSEEGMFRAGAPLPDEIAVNPTHVDCTVTAPNSDPINLEVVANAGQYVAHVCAARVGGWHYGFSGQGGWSGSNSRAFDIKR